MKTFQILSFTALALLAVSCGNKQQETEQTDERFVEQVDEKTGVASLNAYSDSDTITIKGTQYRYSFKFQPIDSLQHITYASGVEYKDNGVHLIIEKDGETVIEKNFTKGSFKSYIPEKLFQTSGLIGFTYNIDRRLSNKFDAFYFIATVGNLDDAEEIAYPLEIRLDHEGGMAISKYEELETEPLRKGLTVDPDEDGV